jgi:hypothetical protein
MYIYAQHKLNSKKLYLNKKPHTFWYEAEVIIFVSIVFSTVPKEGFEPPTPGL